MLFWIIKIIIFSIIFIVLIHNIINFLLETLTISKTKDMIQITNNNYKNIYEVLSRQSQENISQENIFQENISQENITLINSLPNTISFNESNNMKNELTNYLREELNDSLK
jgi:hypothetical protein